MSDASAAAARQEAVGHPWSAIARRRRDAGSEAALVRAVQHGSPRAVDELVDRYWDDAYRAAYLLVRDQHIAEDIAQEAMLSAVGAIDRFDRRRPFAPWLHKVVVNRAVDWLRANGRRPEVSVADAQAVDDQVDTTPAEMSSAMVAALACLSPEQRATIVLRHLLGYDSREIARLIGTRPATVRTRLRRALAELRIAYERESSPDQGGSNDAEPR